MLDHVAATRSRELFTLTVLVIALGIAVGSAVVFDVSMALGAFLAGLVVGRSDMRCAPRRKPCPCATRSPCCSSCPSACCSIRRAARPAGAGRRHARRRHGRQAAGRVLITGLMRYPLATSLSVAVALAQIGEFSFMLSNVGRDLDLLTPEASNVLVAVAILSIVANPSSFARSGRSTGGPGAPCPSPPRGSIASAPARRRATIHAAPLDPAHRAIVVGYGPTGRTVTRLLRDNGFEPTIVDMNVQTVRELREQGVRAVYGDATHRDTLIEAGAADSDNLILTSAGMPDSAEAIRHAKTLNPRIHVLARAPYIRDILVLHEVGAEEVVSAEGEVALALTEIILHRLGATPDQIESRARASPFRAEAGLTVKPNRHGDATLHRRAQATTAGKCEGREPVMSLQSRTCCSAESCVALASAQRQIDAYRIASSRSAIW